LTLSELSRRKDVPNLLGKILAGSISSAKAFLVKYEVRAHTPTPERASATTALCGLGRKRYFVDIMNGVWNVKTRQL
jgi:hypothetical protein